MKISSNPSATVTKTVADFPYGVWKIFENDI